MTRLVSVVTVAEAGDRHADAVVSALTALGVDAVRLDCSDVVSGQLAVHPGELTVTVAGQQITIDGSTTVWWFRSRAPRAVPGTKPEETQFIAEESAAFLVGALKSVGVRWVDDPYDVDHAELKLLQLRTASALGVPVPDTLVTNMRVAGQQFNAAHAAVAKPLSNNTSITGPHIAPAVQRVDVPGGWDRLDSVPTMLQQDMLAVADLRVVVIGQQAWAWRRLRGAGEIDWRTVDQDGTGFVAYDCPEQLSADAVAVTSAMGISMSTQDWVEVPGSSRPVFLESNPQGAWMFLDGADVRVVPALAAHLAGTPASSGVWPRALKRVGYDFLSAKRAPDNDGMKPPVFSADSTKWVPAAAVHAQAVEVARSGRDADVAAAAKAEDKANRLLQLDLALIAITLTLGGYQVHQVAARSGWWLPTLLPVLAALALLALSAAEASQIDRVGFYLNADARRLSGMTAQQAKVELVWQMVQSARAADWTATHKHSDLMQARAWFSRGLLALMLAGVTAAVVTGFGR